MFGSCKNVSSDVRYQVQQSLNKIGNKKQRLNEAMKKLVLMKTQPLKI
jgi:hypothetical protein